MDEIAHFVTRRGSSLPPTLFFQIRTKQFFNRNHANSTWSTCAMQQAWRLYHQWVNDNLLLCIVQRIFLLSYMYMYRCICCFRIPHFTLDRGWINRTKKLSDLSPTKTNSILASPQLPSQKSRQSYCNHVCMENPSWCICQYQRIQQ